VEALVLSRRRRRALGRVVLCREEIRMTTLTARRRRTAPRSSRRAGATLDARLDRIEEELAVVNGVLAYLVKRVKVIEVAQLAEIRRLDRLLREAKR
jgi:hypothetical protein